MNKFTALAGTGLLLIGSVAYAQASPGPMETGPMDTGPMDTGTSDPAMPETTMPETGASTDSSMDMGPTDPATADTTMPADTTHMPHADGQTDTPHDHGAMTTAETGAMDGNAMDSGAMDSAAAFTDAEIESFATAAVEIQNLQGDTTTKQEQAAAIVANSGLEAATFNAIAQAMQTDPELAQRVQLAAGGMQTPAQPEG